MDTVRDHFHRWSLPFDRHAMGGSHVNGCAAVQRVEDNDSHLAGFIGGSLDQLGVFS
jgi:hypothetical protein